MTMRVLGIDTSTKTAALALFSLEPFSLLATREKEVTVHSDDLLSLIRDTLAEAELELSHIDVFACGAGPGSFTGLRIGLSTAKALAFSLGQRLTLFSSLAALAARAPDRSSVVATFDAFQGQLYVGRYAIENGLPRALTEEESISPTALRAELAQADRPLIVGSGALRYPELAEVATLLDGAAGPRATDVARVAAETVRQGQWADVRLAAPRYLRGSAPEEKEKLGR